MLFNARRLPSRVTDYPRDQELETGRSKRVGTVVKVAARKLVQLDAAETLEFLRFPPGNRLEELKGDHSGQHSMRVNDQWRICFRWTGEC